MLTAWGKKILSIYRTSNEFILHPINNNLGKCYIEAKDISGNVVYLPMSPRGTAEAMFFSALLNKTTSPSQGIFIGSDGHEESENDYTLGSQIITSQSYISPITDIIYDDVNHKYIGRTDYTIVNNTGEEMTIREVGKFVCYNSSTTLGGNADNTANTRVSVMIDRTVLVTPVVIPDGESGVLRLDYVYG